MNTRTHRIVLLAVALAFTLSACGDPEVGVTGEEIVIGTWTPLTGPTTELSVMAKAMDAYFQSVNDQGGVHGRKLKLIIKDDGYDPSRTPGVVEELIEQDQVFAILGGNGTANGLAVKDYILEKMVPWINPGSGSRNWTIPVSAYIFTVYPSYVTEGRILARYAVENLEVERAGLFYQDDSYGREGQEGVRVGMRGLQKELEVEVPYRVGETDFSSHAKKLYDGVLDTVFLWALPGPAKALIAEFEKINAGVKFRSMEIRANYLGSGLLSDPVMLDGAGELWEGAIVATHMPDPESNEPGVVRAREIMSQYAPDVPWGTYALMGLNRAELLVEGLRRSGRSLIRLKLIVSLEGMENWSDNILGQPVTFSKDDHQGFNSVRLMQVEDGVYTSLTGWLKP
jgi:ABC-type branched-subunit amino acid transport system substrate-binding protein